MTPIEALKIKEKLHSIPESAHNEEKTSAFIIELLNTYKPDKIYTNIAGFGVIACFQGNREGSSKMFRCELDAVPLLGGPEHLCGHDGHMAILIALADELSTRSFAGIVYLLFQPAEENGKGAAMMIEEIKNMGLEFDYSFALHNNPNYNLNDIIIYRGTYAPASIGMEVKLEGRASHAAYPEKANSPLDALMSMVLKVKEIQQQSNMFSDFVLATVVNFELGERNYGVTPGKGVLRITLRANKDEDLAFFKSELEREVSNIAFKHTLKYIISYHDYFPATINDDILNDKIIAVAQKSHLKVIISSTPTRGSDDFSHFSKISKALFFDIGNGLGADIHQSNYIFNNKIIAEAVGIYRKLIDSLE